MARRANLDRELARMLVRRCLDAAESLGEIFPVMAERAPEWRRSDACTQLASMIYDLHEIMGAEAFSQFPGLKEEMLPPQD